MDESLNPSRQDPKLIVNRLLKSAIPHQSIVYRYRSLSFVTFSFSLSRWQLWNEILQWRTSLHDKQQGAGYSNKVLTGSWENHGLNQFHSCQPANSESISQNRTWTIYEVQRSHLYRLTNCSNRSDLTSNCFRTPFSWTRSKLRLCNRPLIKDGASFCFWAYVLRISRLVRDIRVS